MAKQVKKEGLTVNKLYMGVLATITTAFVIVLALVLLGVFEYHSMTSLKKVNADNFTTKETDSYYVLIYEKDNDENALIEDKIVEYANFAKGDEEALPIYILEYTLGNASVIKEKLSSSFNVDKDFPCLLTISGGKVSQTKTTVSGILQLLEDNMK